MSRITFKYQVPWFEETDLAKVVREVDCSNMTRVQKERFHSIEDYQEAACKYILSLDLVEQMRPEAISMHLQPRVNEIPEEVDTPPGPLL